jgi:hypothetical protein
MVKGSRVVLEMVPGRYYPGTVLTKHLAKSKTLTLRMDYGGVLRQVAKERVTRVVEMQEWWRWGDPRPAAAPCRSRAQGCDPGGGAEIASAPGATGRGPSTGGHPMTDCSDHRMIPISPGGGQDSGSSPAGPAVTAWGKGFKRCTSP